MNRRLMNNSRIFTLLCVGLLASGTVLADKPASVGGGHKQSNQAENSRGKHSDKKGDHDDQANRSDKSSNNRSGNRDNKHYSGNNADERNSQEHNRSLMTGHFDDHSRKKIHDYYTSRRHEGHCPPGLRKKNNACMPPGLTKKWNIGQTLPQDVVLHSIEPQILGYLGPPPPRLRYVRVDSDILLITKSTGMVLDAIDNSGIY